MIETLFAYATLRLIWWVLLGVLLIGFATTDGFDMGVGALLPFVAKTDTRTARHDQHRRADLGRQSGVVHSRRRRDLRRLAGALCAELLGLLSGDVLGVVRAHPAAGRVQVSVEARERDVAPKLGLGAVRWRRRAGADLRRGGRQHACRACRSISPTICVRSTKARCSGCSIRWRFIAGWSPSPCW